MTRLTGLARLASLALVACDVASEPLGTSRAAIIAGTDSVASEDAAVLLVHYDALSKDGSAGCSGVLLAPTLVLTARHCVSVTGTTLACNADGTARGGGAVTSDFVPSKLYVFAGKDRPDYLSGTARPVRGAEILHDGAKNLCNHDLALLVLDAPLTAPIAPVRLDAETKVGEVLTLFGWGITETTNTPEHRQKRADVPVLAVGPSDGTGPAELRIGEGGCAGDSGGPAIAASGAVVGVLSRGGNGSGDEGKDNCTGPNATNVYSSVAGFRDLLLAGYAKVGQKPWLEGGRDPRLPDETPAGDDGSSGGCAMAKREAGFAPSAFVLALAFALVVRRRRLRA